MTVFSELEEDLSVELDVMYAERTQILRQTKGEYFASSVAAPDPADLVVGIIDLNPLVVTVQDQSQYDGMQPLLAGIKVHISYDLSVFADRSAWPVQNDLIKALDMEGQPEYKITRAEPDGVGRILCVCVPA